MMNIFNDRTKIMKFKILNIINNLRKILGSAPGKMNIDVSGEHLNKCRLAYKPYDDVSCVDFDIFRTNIVLCFQNKI